MTTISTLTTGINDGPLKVTICSTTPIIKSSKSNTKFLKAAVADETGACAVLVFNCTIMDKLIDAAARHYTLRLKRRFKYQQDRTIIVGDSTPCTVLAIPTTLEEDQISSAKDAIYQAFSPLAVAVSQKKSTRVSTKGKVTKVFPSSPNSKVKRLLLEGDVSFNLWDPHHVKEIKIGSVLKVQDVRVADGRALETMAGSNIEEMASPIVEARIVVIGTGVEDGEAIISVIHEEEEKDFKADPILVENLEIPATYAARLQGEHVIEIEIIKE